MIDRFRAELRAQTTGFRATARDEYVEVLFRAGRKSEGPAYFARRPVPGVERHPQRPAAALGGVAAPTPSRRAAQRLGLGVAGHVATPYGPALQ